MKAIICTQYGPPEVLQLQDVPQPVSADNDVLINVRAGVVGPSDCAFRKADPFIIRLMYGFFRPKNAIPGVELAGEVASVGKNVRTFKPGDRVFGISVSTFGAQAEYVALPDNSVLALQPSNATDEESVGIVDGAVTALTFLRDVAKLKPGQHVLINGASGAVGAYAVQLARHTGAVVTGVCSSANVALVKSLGADHVIDYTREDLPVTARPMT